MKIPNKRELQQIALNHSSDIDFKDFLVNDTTLPSDDPLKVASATFLLVSFVCLKRALVKQGKMFFISLRKPFSFLR